MPTFERSIEIAAPIQSVYAFHLDTRNAARIASDGQEFVSITGEFPLVEGGEVEFPITAFVRTLVRGDSIRGFPPPHTLALLSIFEPSSLAFASFFGPGGHWAPELKLIITAGHTVELP